MPAKLLEKQVHATLAKFVKEARKQTGSRKAREAPSKKQVHAKLAKYAKRIRRSVVSCP